MPLSAHTSVTARSASTMGDRSLYTLLAVVAATATVVAATSDEGSAIDLCPVRRCTGGYCPGCGGSRAVVALMRGDVSTSWAANPWVILLVAQLFVVGAVLVRSGVQRLQALVLPALIFNLVLGSGIWALRLGLGIIPAPFGL